MPGGQNTGITATGTTIIGLDVEEFEPDYIDTDLEIEEVYLESGDQVKAGTAMKKAQETLDELEDAKTEAQENLNEFESLLGDGILRTTNSGDVIMVAYEAGYAQGINELGVKQTYETSVNGGTTADNTYRSTLETLQTSVDSAQEDLEEINEIIQNFEDFVGDGTIYAERNGIVTQLGYEAGDDLGNSGGMYLHDWCSAGRAGRTAKWCPQDTSKEALWRNM